MIATICTRHHDRRTQTVTALIFATISEYGIMPRGPVRVPMGAVKEVPAKVSKLVDNVPWYTKVWNHGCDTQSEGQKRRGNIFMGVVAVIVLLIVASHLVSGGKPAPVYGSTEWAQQHVTRTLGADTETLSHDDLVMRAFKADHNGGHQ